MMRGRIFMYPSNASMVAGPPHLSALIHEVQSTLVIWLLKLVQLTEPGTGRARPVAAVGRVQQLQAMPCSLGEAFAIQAHNDTTPCKQA
jgi:hypothetical protein